MGALIVIFTVLLFILLIPMIKVKLDRMFYVLLGILFCGLLIVSLYNPYKLFNVSGYAYFVLFLGFGSFFLGYAINRTYITKYHIRVLDGQNLLTFLKKNYLFWGVFFMAFGTILYMAITQWRLILFQGGLGNLKLDFFELVFNNNSALYFFYQIVIFPLFHLSSILFAYLLLNKGDKKYIACFLIYAIVFSFVGGKRGYFAIIFEYYVIAFVVTKVSQGAGLWGLLKSSYKLILLAVFVFIAAAFMTSLSGGIDGGSEKLKESGAENAKNLIVYNVGAFRALDYALNNDYLDKAGGYQLGRATLGGAVDYYGAGILSRLGLPIQPVRANTMNLLQNNYIYVGQETKFNYVYTAFMYFFFDLGIIGVILFSFLFGWFVRYSMRLYAADRTIGSLGLICFLFLSSIQLMGSWFNISLAAQPALFLFYYIRKKELKYLKHAV